MKSIKPALIDKFIIAVVSFVLIATIPLKGVAQSTTRGVGTIDAGTTVYVRTNEEINTSNADDQTFSGMVDRDVVGRNGRVVIPRGSHVDLVVREMSNDELALDLDSVTMNGQRYGINADENVIGEDRKEGIGANDRTAKHVGGGAVLGAIIGAIAGGGKGAAIGAGAGAAAGAGVQVLTRGKRVRVPAESLLTFRLSEPLRPVTSSYRGSGVRNNTAYRQYGRSDGSRSYETARNPANISVGRDKYVRWTGPENGSVYVQVDNGERKLFATGPSGTQSADWMRSGHLYTFILENARGNEVARARWDLR